MACLLPLTFLSHRAALQLAVDSPSNSLVAQHAASLLPRPFARLMTKEEDWPACISTLRGHEKYVSSVVMSADGATLISGSNDHTIRCACMRGGVQDDTGIH